MARTTSFVLGEHFSDFVNDSVKGGRYNNASEVVRAGLRLLENSEERRRAVLEALTNAPLDDEPITDDDRQAVAEAQANPKRYTSEEVLKMLEG